jgi:lysophospholipase L1-like esterase
MARPLSRYVAVGDSFTEGLDDLRQDGTPRGWADRIANVLTQTEPDFHYANLAVRSRRIDAIVEGQVAAAVAMRPDLVSIAAGGNDLLDVRPDLDRITMRMDEAVGALTATGAVTVVFAGFDPRARLPLGRLIAGRTAAYNERVVATAERHRALLVNLWSMPELRDARLWSPDRLHLSPIGHLHVAGVVLHRLGRPTPDGWPVEISQPAARSRLRPRVDDVTWSHQHFAPWLVRKVRGRAAGDGRTAKRPSLDSWAAETLPTGQPDSC